MKDKQALLNRLRTQPESQIVCQLTRLLERDDIRLLTGRGHRGTVADTFALWSTRIKNLDLTGIQYNGAESLLARLQALPPDEKLEQIAIVAPGLAGNLFFEDSQPNSFVGAAIFSTRVVASTSHQMEFGEAIAT